MTTVDMQEPSERVVYQPRCVYCKRQQWAIMVAPISRGQAGCAWCGKVPPVFYREADYRTALNGLPR